MFFSKKTTNKTSSLQLKTSNITKHINEFAHKQNVPYYFIDFNIISTEHILKQSQSKDTKIDISKLSSYINKHSSIKQIFSIDLFVSKKRKFLIKSKIFLSRDKTQAYINIYKTSKIPYRDTLEDELLEFINKEKAKYNILLGTCDGSLLSDIASLIAVIKEKKSLPEDMKLQIANFDFYRESKEGYIKYLYLDKQHSSDRERAFVYVQEKQKILEIFLGDLGKDGIDCMGNFKPCQQISKIDTEKLNISDNIAQDIDGRHIYTIAKISGMLTYKNSLFDISKDVNLASINFKEVSYFYAPVDDESIGLNIQSLDIDKDAVGSNITLIANSVTIDGDIGANVSIKAHTIRVNGLLHKRSKLEANKIYAHTVRGTAQADYIEVTSLENGFLQGGEVHIQRILGGVICGKDVFINNLRSYSTIKASNKIEINSLNGKYNDFLITPIADKNTKELIETIQKYNISYQNKYTNSQIIEFKKRFSIYLKKGKILVAKIKSMKQKNQDVMAPSTVLYKLKNRLEHTKTILQSHNKYTENIKALEEYDSCIYDASVLLHDTWSNHNLIVFSKISDNRRISFEPEGHVRAITFNTNMFNTA